MINSSVGFGLKNNVDDVFIVQNVINWRKDLTRLLSDRPVSGVFTKNDSDLVKSLQLALGLRADGIISPYGETIRKLWPTEFAYPTKHGLRKPDSYGAGHHGASRGTRKHDGTDYISVAGQSVLAPMSGVISRITKAYSNGTDARILSGVEVTSSDGTKCLTLYISPTLPSLGHVVKAGVTVLGKALTLNNRYPGITDHVHVRVHKLGNQALDPQKLIGR
jgi:murein DD-endopeptidase MepM/ murein hydrolase activator NlpD